MMLRDRCLPTIEWLEYIEGTPTYQVIDTGQPVNYETFDITMKWSLYTDGGSHVNYVPIFGTYISETDPCTRLILNNTDWNYRVNINNRASSSGTLYYALNNGTSITNTMTLAGSGYVEYNSHSEWLGLSNSGYTNGNNCFIGECRNYVRQNSSFSNYRLRIFVFRISINNVLTRNMLPCIFNGQVGMYDKVTKQFFGNSGVGSFVAGPVI